MAVLRTFFKCSGSKHHRIIFDRLRDLAKINCVAPKSTISGTIVQDSYSSSAVSTPRKDPLDISFADYKSAFKSKTLFELSRAYLVYTICSSETIVENNMKVKI